MTVLQKPITSEVGFEGAGGFKLTGTLELPANRNGKVPAVLLLPGSGPSDRDGNTMLMSDKVDILKDIADRLAESGIASYRFDKRAIARYREAWPKALPDLGEFFAYDKFVGDAEAALKMMAARRELNPKRLAVLGHSEGASYALQMGVDVKPAALVLMGCMGRTMSAVLHDQIGLRVSNAPGIDAKKYVDYTDAACAAMAANKPLPPNPPQGLGGLFNVTTAKLLGAFCRIDPTDLAKHYAGPVLALDGADDQQVSPTKDFPRLLASLKARSGAVTEGHLIPNASHAFKSTANSKDEFGGPLQPPTLNDIVSFLKKNLAS
jgi:alpha-beta hydrolase superfamily lysophospholipase